MDYLRTYNLFRHYKDIRQGNSSYYCKKTDSLMTQPSGNRESIHQIVPLSQLIQKPLHKVLLILILLTGCQSKSLKDRTVYVQPLGKVPVLLTDTIQKAIQHTYGMKMVLSQSVPLPPSCFVQIKSPRYRADCLIEYLDLQRNKKIDYVLGFTTLDISTTKRDGLGRVQQPESRYGDWGVMGLAYCPGHAAVVSTFRLKGDASKLTSRCVKVVLHEVGHNLGLPHCPNKRCVMTDAVESIRTVDHAQAALCAQCQKKIGLR